MKKILRATSAIGLVCIAPLAMAAGAPPQGPVRLEEIIVTATHRKENLQRTAISVTAVSGAKLEAAGVVQAQDLSKTVPGLSISSNGAGSQVYLRGVGTFAANTYATSPVAMNLDGIYLSLPAMANGVFFDLSRVEVLKGPQGTLYGKNATAGAINLITNQPGPKFNGYFTQEVGNYGLFKSNAAVNMPLSNQVSVRLAGQFLNRNGYYSDGTGRTGGESVRLQVNYRPNEDISLTIGADYSHATGDEEPLVVIGANPNNPWEGPSTAASNAQIIAARAPGAKNGAGLPPFFASQLPTITRDDEGLRNDSAGLRGDLEWNLGFANLTVLASYRHLATEFINDPGFQATQGAMAHQGSVEARLSSPADNGKWKWQAGLYYFDNDSYQVVHSNQGFVTPYLGFDDTDKEAAAFGEITYSVLPQFRITGGLRGNTETLGQTGFGHDIFPPSTFTSFGNYLTGLGVPPFLLPIIEKSVLSPIVYSIANSATFRNISVKAAAEYDLAPNSLAYASFTSGFRSGGINADLNTPTVSNVFRPETIDAYAIGSKNRFFGGSLQLNGEAFYWDYKNHQELYLTQSQADPSVEQPLTHNIGASTLKGFSADAEYKPTPNDQFSAQVEYVDGTFEQFSYNVYQSVGFLPVTGCRAKYVKTVTVAGQAQWFDNVNCSGKPFSRSPRWSATLSYQHIFNLGGDNGDLLAEVDSKLITSEFLAIDYTAAEHQGGRSVTNLSLSYEPANAWWTLTGYIRNVENSAVYTEAFQYPFASNVTLATISPPRTFGGILKVRF